MKTGVIGTGTLTNKERLLAAYAACNRQDHVYRFKAGLIARKNIQNVEAAPR